MRRLALAMALTSLITLLSGPPSGQAQASPVTLTVDANVNQAGVQASRIVAEGSTFSVDILIGSVSDLQAFNFELEYGQTLLSAPTVTVGPSVDRNPDAEETFLSSTGRTWSCSPPDPGGDIDPSPTIGVAFLSCFSTGITAGPDVGATETLLAKIEFNPLAIGTSALTLKSVNVFKDGGIESGSCDPTVIVAASCTDGSITVDTDTDSDTVPDSLDNCLSTPNTDQANADGDARGDACETADCIAVYTLWVTPPGDTDCDGWTTADENTIGTDPDLACSLTGAVTHPGDPTKIDDEPVDNWPADMNDDQVVNLADVLYLAPPVFFSVAPGPPYDVRYDLNLDGVINLSDILYLAPPVFFATCTP